MIKSESYLARLATAEAQQTVVEVVGKKYEDALKLAGERKLLLRIYKLDGQPRVCTRDLRLNRVNVNVEGAIVVDAHLG